jgi:uncharacterized protein (TIGR03382 family)
MLAPALVIAVSLAQVGTVNGELVVVPDPSGSGHTTNNLIAGVGSTLCAFAARGLFSVKPDVFDGVVTFTTHPLSGMPIGSPATPKGTIVRATSTGAGYGSPLIVLAPSEYGSAARLSHCVFMGPVQNAPMNPDADFLLPAFGGGTAPSGLTGLEVLGHEYGHHWLVQSAFDDGSGLDVLHRADSREPLMGMQTNRVSMATLHYSHLADSQSVMYGNFVTPLGGDQYRLSGGERKYGAMDQYFMGLRPAVETPPLLVLDDGSGMGLIGTPLRRGESEAVTAQRAVQVRVEDFIRAQGARVPAFPSARRCFRVAFVLAVQQGSTASAAQLAQVEAYRQRFEAWFFRATDGRANVVTSLDPFAECPEPVLGGVDAGVDAGVGVMIDAGVVEVVDAGVVDAGDDEPLETGKIRPGCGCSSGEGLLVLASLLLAWRRPVLSKRSRGPFSKWRDEELSWW